jgi:hypothetical protein
MTELRDPPRLAESAPLSPDVGSLLRDAAQDLPTEGQLARVAERLEPIFASSAAEAPRPAARAVKPFTWGAGAVALGLLGYAALQGARHSGQDPAPAGSATPAAQSSVAPPAPAATVEAPEPQTIPSAAPPSSAEPVNHERTAPASPARSAERHAGPSEAELLERARRALATDPARALALAQQHQKQYPNGVLQQERDVITIEALRRLGKVKEADQRAGTFQRQYPDSAHRRSVETGLSK